VHVHEPEQVELDVLGHRVSALVAHAEAPRGVVLALHGGSSSKEYFDAAADPALSLLRLGPPLGFTVVAPDRPGYGRDGFLLDTMPAGDRTDLLYATIDAALGGRSGGAGTFLVCHSMGCISGLRMAADPRGRHLLGVEISGTGLTLDARAAAIHDGDGLRGGRGELRRLIWGPEELYPEWTRESQHMAATPTSEGSDIGGWATELPELAGKVPVPVRYTLAEHESWWRPGQEALDEVAALFTAAPFVETALERGAGHNISLGFTARAYHLRVLAFAEECRVRALVRPAPSVVPDPGACP
jgi:pimeloyl-ACP methyl ester carboxylesterase